jgi:prepilin-type processing-associated H-X9-DG protein
LIEETAITPISFLCKGAGNGRCNFALNKNVEILGASSPPNMVLLFETYPGWNQVGGPEILTTKNHNNEGCNVLFVDGHVEFVRKSSLGRLRWTDSPVPVASRSQGSFIRRPLRQLPEQPRIDFPEAPPTLVVEILGDVPGVDFSTWQNTGVSLMTDDVLYIQAEGQVNYVNELTLSPDGRGDTFYPSLLPDISFMSLIGKTHFHLLDDGFDSSGTGIYGPGFVGSEFKVAYQGRSNYGLTGDNMLYLAVNDSMDNDNSSSFTVRIWIVRDGQVVHNNSERSSKY